MGNNSSMDRLIDYVNDEFFLCVTHILKDPVQYNNLIINECKIVREELLKTKESIMRDKVIFTIMDRKEVLSSLGNIYYMILYYEHKHHGFKYQFDKSLRCLFFEVNCVERTYNKVHNIEVEDNDYSILARIKESGEIWNRIKNNKQKIIRRINQPKLKFDIPDSERILLPSHALKINH